MATLVCLDCDTHFLVRRRDQRGRRLPTCPYCDGRLRRFKHGGRQADPHRPAYPFDVPLERRLEVLISILENPRSTFGDRRWASEELERLCRLRLPERKGA